MGSLLAFFNFIMAPQKRKSSRTRSSTHPARRASKADKVAKAMGELTRVQLKDLLLKGRKPPVVAGSNYIRTLDGVIRAANEWQNGTNNLMTGYEDESWLNFDQWEDLSKGATAIKRVLAEEKANFVPKLSLEDSKMVQAVKNFMPVWLRYMRKFGSQWAKKDLEVFRHFFATNLMVRAKF